MYTKQLLEDVSRVVNPHFFIDEISDASFKKLNEAIEQGLEIEISNLLTEDAEESKLKSRLSRIFGKSKIPAATLGLIMLATGAAQACGQKTLEGTNLRTRCFTPPAMAEIKKEQENLEKAALLAQQKRSMIRTISFKDPETKKFFPNKGQYQDKDFDTARDKMQLVSVSNVDGDTFVGALDTLDKENPILLVPSLDGKKTYVYINKRHTLNGHKVAWQLVKIISKNEGGPLSQIYTGMARFIENDKKAKARDK